METNTIILNKKQIAHKIKRIAYQVYEANTKETEVVIAGITDNGYVLAKKIKEEVERISPIKVTLCKVSMNKKNPINTVTSSIEIEKLENKSLLLVDDVLNS